MSTILEEVVARAVPFLDAETADAQILKLLRQVGELERDLALAVKVTKGFGREIFALMDRNASLEDGIAAISAMCYWRVMGYCSLNCGGRVFCGTEGLIAFAWPRMDQIDKYALAPQDCLVCCGKKLGLQK